MERAAEAVRIERQQKESRLRANKERLAQLQSTWKEDQQLKEVRMGRSMQLISFGCAAAFVDHGVIPDTKVEAYDRTSHMLKRRCGKMQGCAWLCDNFWLAWRSIAHRSCLSSCTIFCFT